MHDSWPGIVELFNELNVIMTALIAKTSLGE